MYNYILGMVTVIEGTYVVVEAGGIGYQVYTPNPYSFDLNTTYQVYIIRENDTIETVLNKYNITRETLNLYNDLTELKLGDKLIIPQVND